MWEEPLFQPSQYHDWKLEPFGAVEGHEPDTRILGPFRLVGIREKRETIDEAAEGRLGLATLVLARGRHELGEVFDPRLGLLTAFVVKVLQVAALVECLCDGDGDRLAPRNLRQVDDEVAKYRKRLRRS